MAHGHYFESLGLFWDVYYTSVPSSSSTVVAEFIGGDFSFDIDRRKVCVVTPRTPMFTTVVGRAYVCVHGKTVVLIRPYHLPYS